MKFSSTLFITTLCFAHIIKPADSAYLCLPNDITTYYATPQDFNAAYDWSATYSTGVFFRGVGICAVTGASGKGSTTTNVYRSNMSSSINNQCWCKLIYPAESKFIYYGSFNSESECATVCQTNCVNLVNTDTATDIGKIYINNLERD